MFAIFTGNPLDPRDEKESLTLWGVTFPINVPVAIPSSWTDDLRRKIAGNNHFRVEGEAPSEPVAVEAEVSQVPPSNPSPRGRQRRTKSEG